VILAADLNAEQMSASDAEMRSDRGSASNSFASFLLAAHTDRRGLANVIRAIAGPARPRDVADLRMEDREHADTCGPLSVRSARVALPTHSVTV